MALAVAGVGAYGRFAQWTQRKGKCNMHRERRGRRRKVRTS